MTRQMSEFEIFYLGQEAGVSLVDELATHDTDGVINILLGNQTAEPIILVDRERVGVPVLESAQFMRGWWSGFRLAFIIRCRRPAFCARYQELAAEQESQRAADYERRKLIENIAAARRDAAIHGEAGQ